MEMSYFSRHQNLTGCRFGRLTAISFEDTTSSGNAIWRVRCDCGVEFLAIAFNLKSGKTQSCGCYRSEATAKRNLERRR